MKIRGSFVWWCAGLSVVCIFLKYHGLFPEIVPLEDAGQGTYKPSAKRVENFENALQAHGNHYEDRWTGKVGESESSPFLESPECDNILNNITQGRWVKKIHLKRYQNEIESLIFEEKDIESELKEYWLIRGIQNASWREDLQCGYYSYETQPTNTTWYKVGSWCDPQGARPCCSNNLRGICMEPSDEFCNCSKCVDLRKYKHAEVSEWIVSDIRCKWHYYKASEICDVVERSPFTDIHFVGESFMRNMFRTFAMMITDDFVYGAVTNRTKPSTREMCTRRQQFFWTPCRNTINDVAKTLNPEKLCGGRGFPKFKATTQAYPSPKFADRFLELVKSKIGIPGSLIVLGIGFQMQCNPQVAIKKFLGPAIDAITDHYGQPPRLVDQQKLSSRWPQIVLCLPLSIGLLKPPEFLILQNEEKCNKFSSDMISYAANHDIRVIDLRPLTEWVHSFDGTHYGMEVNKMKNLMLLNYIALIDGTAT